MSELHVVTGAFGYSGRYLAERLLDSGHDVRTLTHSPNRENPFAGRVEALPFDFERPERLEASLRGAAVLYNTYWVRFNYATFAHAAAVENTRTLFAAARRAGVGRIVHVSITNPSEDSELEYFRGKAVLERELRTSGVPHSIMRPAVLFGGEDILINNIAWMLRRLPVFGVFGNGAYRLEPIHVEDFAELMHREGGATGERTLDAIGPEAFAYRELVHEIGAAIGVRRPIVSIPPRLGYAAAWLLGRLLRDVVLTREEIAGLMQDRLYTGSPPLGRVKLSEWARSHAAELGRRYASELGRRRDRYVAYARAR